ncbi:MAG: glycosyltransferase family 4 protein [Melioribacteraceae bacterium]|nr:glycosyltransferase family 4 protein [Melioribacteraceae bacterium]
MKVLHINNSDTIGGAARACFNIHNALLSMGVDSNILVQTKSGKDNNVIPAGSGSLSKLYTVIRKGIDFSLISLLTKKEYGRFSFPLLGSNISKNPFAKEADILHLHWINEGFFSLQTLRSLFKINKPVVWTLHDMWAFTGGCHYDNKCGNFKSRCGNCPALKLKSDQDTSSTIFARKIELFNDAKINFVTCSKWLAGEAKSSTLLEKFDITPIPNPINTELYSPTDKSISKQKLNLSIDKLHILFATMTLKEKRKGFHILLDALKLLNENYHLLKEKIEIIVMGAGDQSHFKEIPFKTIFTGRLNNDKEIVNCYNAADLFVAPSIQDNLPNTVMEALSCGVPTAAFNIGGMSDMIDHKLNGYLADEVSPVKLAEAINWLVEKLSATNNLRINAREKVLNNFTEKIVAQKYLELYKSIL